MSDAALIRIAEALERMSPAPMAAPDFAAADAFVWHVEPDRLVPVPKVNRVELPLLVGIDRARDTLLANTLQFARGLPANNALLWGSRGMGKSSLVKAIHAEALAQRLPEFHRRLRDPLALAIGVQLSQLPCDALTRRHILLQCALELRSGTPLTR